MIETYLIYNLILISSTFFVFLYERSEKNIAWIFLSIAFLIVTIPAAIRYNIGIDYRSYQTIFDTIRLGGNAGNVEIGYLWLNQLVIFLGLDFEWFIAFITFLIFILAFASYPKKYATIYHIAYFLVYYLITFTFIRSAIVFSFALLAIMHYLKHKNIYIYIIFALIGMLFHKSSFLMLLLPLIANLPKINILYKYKYVVLALVTIIFFTRNELINFILNSKVTTLLGYDVYAKNMFFTRKTEMGSGLGFALRIMPILLLLFYAKEIIKANRNSIYLIVAAIICLMAAAFSSTMDIFIRFERVFYFVYILIPFVFMSTQAIKLRTPIVIIILLSQLVLFELLILKSQSHQCLGSRISPYVTIFDKHNDTSNSIPGTVCSNI